MPILPGCHKFGFNLARGKLLAIVPTINTARIRTLARIGLVGERIATSHIKNQDLGWSPLSEEYVLWKQKHGYSTKVYVQTSSYFQAITSWPKNMDTIYIGVKKGVTTKDGTEYGKIAGVLEGGTKDGKIPPRPLWGPTLVELRAKVPGLVGNIFGTTPGIERLR